MTRYLLQDPGETLTWTQDWTDFLASGQTIASRLWTLSPDASPSLLSNATSDVVSVAGLTWGTVYTLTEHIVTNDGVEAERSIIIRCEDR